MSKWQSQAWSGASYHLPCGTVQPALPALKDTVTRIDMEGFKKSILRLVFEEQVHLQLTPLSGVIIPLYFCFRRVIGL